MRGTASEGFCSCTTIFYVNWISQHIPFRQPSSPLLHYHPAILRGVRHQNNIPRTVQRLQFSIWKGHIHLDFPSLTHLELRESLSGKTVTWDTLPTTLTHLSFFGYHGYTLQCPPKLQTLAINGTYNTSLDTLSSSLRELRLPTSFNQPLQHLPPLKHMKFCAWSRFNHPVDNLPSSLTSITFGRHFNQPVDNLPSSLLEIHFGQLFNHSIDKLPPHLTHLSFAKLSFFNQPTTNLPSSLKVVKFGRKFNHAFKPPPHLSELSFRKEFNQSIKCYPSQITHLRFGRFTHSLELLPPLTHLRLGTGSTALGNLENVPTSLIHFEHGASRYTRGAFFEHEDVDDMFDCGDFLFLQRFYYTIRVEQDENAQFSYKVYIL